MKKFSPLILISLAVVLFHTKAAASITQLKIGSNPSMQQKSAILELESNSQGLLLTRVADTNLINVFNPPDGMIIYYTDKRIEAPFGENSGLFERKNNEWRKVGIIIDSVVDASQLGVRFLNNNGKYTLRIPNAERSLRGLVSTGSQQFGGRKTFVDSIVLQNTHPGSIIFVRNTLSSVNWALTENNTNLYWDNINERLGLGTNTPSATLDVKGNFKLGGNGSILNNIIRDSLETISDIPISAGEGIMLDSPFPGVRSGATAMISPANSLPDGCIISYSYTSEGYVHIRMESLKTNTIPSGTKFYVVVIQ